MLFQRTFIYHVCLWHTGLNSFEIPFFSPPAKIYIFYGTRSNAEFVIHNGFFFQDNAHDRVKIKLGVSKSERLYAMKAEVLARAGIPAWVLSFCLCYGSHTAYVVRFSVPSSDIPQTGCSILASFVFIASKLSRRV